jgi:hypothetical protein
MAHIEERGRVDISEEAASLLSYIRFHASGVEREIQETHQRPSRHNREIERLALWHTVELSVSCGIAVNHPGVPTLKELVAGLEQTARYDVLAAVPLIPQLHPFSLQALARMQQAGRDGSFEAWGESVMRTEAPLVEQWHGWLWNSATSGPGKDDFGESTTLCIAADRLAAALRSLWESGM